MPQQAARAFLLDQQAWLAGNALKPKFADRVLALEQVTAALEGASSPTLHTCVRAARLLFEDMFHTRIRQLQHNFPKDHATLDPATGKSSKFWIDNKRFPTAAAFSLADPQHAAFLVHATTLVAACYGCQLPAGWEAPEALAPILAGIAVAPFAPKKVTIALPGEKEAEAPADEVQAMQAQEAALKAALQAKGQWGHGGPWGLLAGGTPPSPSLAHFPALTHAHARAHAPTHTHRSGCPGPRGPCCHPPPPRRV